MHPENVKQTLADPKWPDKLGRADLIRLLTDAWREQVSLTDELERLKALLPAKRADPKRAWTPEEDAIIVHMRDGGASYEEISKQLEGRTRAIVSVRAWMLKQGRT